MFIEMDFIGVGWWTESRVLCLMLLMFLTRLMNISFLLYALYFWLLS